MGLIGKWVFNRWDGKARGGGGGGGGWGVRTELGAQRGEIPAAGRGYDGSLLRGCDGPFRVGAAKVVNDGADGRKIGAMTTLTDQAVSQTVSAPGGAESVDRSLYPIFDDLASVLEGYLAPEERVQVERAYEFAQIAHSGHTRRSGHPYISHPLAAAIVCAELQLDVPALQAALLHDVMEDCGITRSELVDAFGVDVAKLSMGRPSSARCACPTSTTRPWMKTRRRRTCARCSSRWPTTCGW